jgi:hypothetical protein
MGCEADKPLCDKCFRRKKERLFHINDVAVTGEVCMCDIEKMEREASKSPMTIARQKEIQRAIANASSEQVFQLLELIRTWESSQEGDRSAS